MILINKASVARLPFITGVDISRREADFSTGFNKSMVEVRIMLLAHCL